MKEIDILKDLHGFLVSSEIEYNQNAVYIANPEARQLFIQHRDDYMRIIVMLRQKITRVEAKPRIISRILPTKTRT